MNPESEWFRPPKIVECCSTGDVRRFLLVAEPELGQGIYGVSWEVSQTVCESQAEALERIAKAAAIELGRRIKVGDKHGEGCRLDEFSWKPVFVRQVDGSVIVDGA